MNRTSQTSDDIRAEFEAPPINIKVLVAVVIAFALVFAAAVYLAAPASAQERKGGGGHQEGYRTERCGETSRGVGLVCVYDDSQTLVIVVSEGGAENGYGEEPQVAMFNPWRGQPDALTVAGLPGDPLLLPVEMSDQKSGLSVRVRDELQRLQPIRIDVLGGTAVVADGDMFQIAYATAEARPDGHVDVRRRYGGGRVGTMLDVSQKYYSYDDFNEGVGP